MSVSAKGGAVRKQVRPSQGVGPLWDWSCLLRQHEYVNSAILRRPPTLTCHADDLAHIAEKASEQADGSV